MKRPSFWLALTLGCFLTAGCVNGGQEDGGNPRPLSPAESKLIARAPALGKTSFGPGVDVTVFRPKWLLGESRVVDETIYVIFNTDTSPYQEVGTVSRGILHPLRLAGEYYTLSFRNGNRLISALRPNGERDWYEVRAGEVLPTSAPSSPSYGLPSHVFADGNSCSDGLAGSGSALDELRDHRPVSVLSPAAMLRATGGLLDRATEVYCDHFHGQTYVTLSKLGVIMRLDGNSATLVGIGWIQAASEHHLLITTRTAMMVEADAPR